MVRQKVGRNARIYQFWKDHKHNWSYSAIGSLYHISKVRAWQIIQKERGKEADAAEKELATPVEQTTTIIYPA